MTFLLPSRKPRHRNSRSYKSEALSRWESSAFANPIIAANFLDLRSPHEERSIWDRCPIEKWGVKTNERRKNLARGVPTATDYEEVAESCGEQQCRWLRGDVA